MADLRIVDAPLLPTVKGTEKIPTGGEGNFSVSVNQVADFAKIKWFLATEGYVDNAVGNVQADLNLHKNNVSNPHGVTKVQVGLWNVDNTADVDKPIGSATQAALTTLTQTKADKTYVDAQLNNKADKSTTYSKTETDSLVSVKSDTSYVNTKYSSHIKTFLNTGAALSNTVNGEYFFIISSDSEKVEDLYLNVNGVATNQNKSELSSLLQHNSILGRDAEGAHLATSISTASGVNQQEINDFGGAKWWDKPLGYKLGATVKLENGDIVKSTVANNTNNPNVDMTGWRFDDNRVESIADLLAIQNPKDGQVVYAESYRSGENRGGGHFKFNTQKLFANDGIHCLNGWERLDYSKNYVDTDIAGFYGDGHTDDYPAFKRLHKYILSLSSDAKKEIVINNGHFSVKSLDADAITYGIYGWVALVPVLSNTEVRGHGKNNSIISFDFDYLSWLYQEFTDGAYNLNSGVNSNPILSAFGLSSIHGDEISSSSISDLTVRFNGDKYYYSQSDNDAHQSGKAFPQVSLSNWSLGVVADVKFSHIVIDRNPSAQNISFNYSRAEARDIVIEHVEHLYSGESSSINNKCPDHSSIYCHGAYTRIENNRFVGSLDSTINCAIEFHGRGDILNNEFINTAAPIYLVNLHGWPSPEFSERYDDNVINVRGNNVIGAVYGIGYANGGKLTIKSSNNTIKLRKQKSNATWVGGNVYVHGGIDARGLVNLNVTINSNTAFYSNNDYFEQEPADDWSTADKYINACIATKNIQHLEVTNTVFKGFQGCVLVLEKPPNEYPVKPKIILSGNTYINCGSQQDAQNINYVTDSVVYLSNGNILDFSGADSNVSFGGLSITGETFIDCNYKRVITQYGLVSLFLSADVRLHKVGHFLTPVSFVSASSSSDSYTNYNFDLDFGTISSVSSYGFGKLLLGYTINIEYDYAPSTSTVMYSNICTKLKQVLTLSTRSECLNETILRPNDKPNGIAVVDRDSLNFPHNRSSEIQKTVYNSSTQAWE